MNESVFIGLMNDAAGAQLMLLTLSSDHLQRSLPL